MRKQYSMDKALDRWNAASRARDEAGGTSNWNIKEMPAYNYSLVSNFRMMRVTAAAWAIEHAPAYVVADFSSTDAATDLATHWARGRFEVLAEGEDRPDVLELIREQVKLEFNLLCGLLESAGVVIDAQADEEYPEPELTVYEHDLLVHMATGTGGIR